MVHSQVNRVLSRPCEVWWQGFRSNTYALQQAGWELAVESSFHECEIRLLIRNQAMRLFGVSDRAEFDFYRAQHMGFESPTPTFRIVHFVPTIEVMRVHDRFENFKQIDAAPQLVTSEIKSIEDFGIFATPLVRTEELIVEPADVSALLEQIRRMQSPEQKAIRERARTRDRRDDSPEIRKAQQFHAQIISLKAA